MFNPVQNGWAQQDYAHYQREDRQEAREAAIDAAIGWEIDGLEALSATEFRHGKATMEQAMEMIADNANGEQERVNRYLFQLWQCRNAKPDSTERKMRDYAVSIIAQIINSAIMEVVTKEVKERMN